MAKTVTAQAQEARIKRSMRNDRIATGILTFIVGVVIAIVISMVLYILAQGIGQLLQPGFLTEPSRSNGTEGGIAYQLFDSFYLLILTLIISLPISLGGAVFLVEYAPEAPSPRSLLRLSRPCPACRPSLSVCSASLCSR